MVEAGEDGVHHARGAEGGVAGAGTMSVAEQLGDDGGDERFLNGWRMRALDFLDAVFCFQREQRRVEGGQSQAAALAAELKKSLGVPPARLYLTCAEVAASNWGWNGELFG